MRAGIALKKILIAGEAGQTTNYENALAAMQVHFVTSLQVKDVDEYDGLLLPGGGDVDPKLFGQLLIPETEIRQYSRWEQQLIRKGQEKLTPELDRVLQMLTSGALGQRFDDVAASLLTPRFGAADSYMTVADFESYKAAKKRAVEVYQDRTRFAQMSLTNIARAGIFSSDRSVEQYAKEIWDL